MFAVAGGWVESATVDAGRSRPTTVLGLVHSDLGRFQPDSLRPVGPRGTVAESHAPGVLSPDGSRLAFGLSKSPEPGTPVHGRVGLSIVDPATLEVLHEVQTGIAAEQVGFPGPVAAMLQGGELVIVDPDRGVIERRLSGIGGECIAMQRPAATPGKAVFTTVGAGGRVRIAVVGRRGGVRTARLRRLRAAGPSCGVGVAADPARDRVFVVARSLVAEVALGTLRTRYRRVPSLASRCGSDEPCGDARTVAWIPGAGLALAGETIAGNRGERSHALGLVVLDRRLRHVRWHDMRASAVAASRRRVLALGDGVRGYGPDGRHRFTALRGRAVQGAEIVAGRAYVASGSRLFVLGAGRGAVRSRHGGRTLGFWFL
jgi:hypothetical protein